ncbi:hypothetical protein FSP39_002758 [Pinctada imbricata]|uniref:Peroxisomal ATPase PEX6 n=1 Tax=Pinctada imbricata TaxID=66713 RepID=A0AA88XV58_PINIB|nr:hypothetical protein FSP39_002758 [Pinctada imbricata]
MTARARRATLLAKDYKDDRHRLHLQISRLHANILEATTDRHTFHVAVVGKRIPPEKRVSSAVSTPPSALSSGGYSSPIYSFDRLSYSGSQCSTSCSQKHFESDDDLSNDSVEILSTVHIYEHDTTKSRDEEILITCSYDFLSHYQLDHENDIHVKMVNLFPVQKMVIGVFNDFDLFSKLQREKFCHDLLLEVCQTSVLLRSNDLFLASSPKILYEENSDDTSRNNSDLHVIECCPIRHGILTLDTELIFSCLEDEGVRQKEFLFTLPRSLSKEKKDLFLVSDFCKPMKGPSLQSSFSYSRDSSPLTADEFDINFECIEQQVLWLRLLCKPQNDALFDPMYVIGMSKETMLKYALFEESLVKVSLSIKIPVVASRIAMIKCVCVNMLPNEDKVYISPLLKFNLQNNSCAMSLDISEVLKIERLKEAAESDVDLGTVSTSLHTDLPVAEEVIISFVMSPWYHPSKVSVEAILSYFSVPRLLTKGDILPIQSRDDPEYSSSQGPLEKRQTTIFFKVVKIVGPKSNFPSYICDRLLTKLIQQGSVHSYVPLVMEPYLIKRPLTYWDHCYQNGMNEYVEKLESLIRPHLHNRLDFTNMKDVLPSVMLIGASGCGKTTTTYTVARRLNLNVLKVNCHSLYGEAPAAIEARIFNIVSEAINYSPCILLLHSIHALGKDKERNSDDPRVASAFRASIKRLMEEHSEYPVVVVGTTHSPAVLAADIHEAFLHSVNIEVPNEYDRAEILDALLQNVCYSGDLCGQYLAQRTAGYVLGDLVALVSHAARGAYKAVMKDCLGTKKALSYEEEEDLASAGIVVQHENFVTAIDQLQAAHSDTIGAPKIPNVEWSDVGGLMDVKSEILDTIQLPLQFPELLASGLRRSGLLFYGPPGTGKTMMAKAIATECSLNFLSVKGPELINMYVGQSEQNVREVFERARSATPCVIFFDELDSLAPNRGKSGDSGGVMDRVVSQLLAELDGLNKSCDIFVIGATNRPDLLDPALLRPGRFDKLLYLGVSDDNASQLKILQALTRKFKLSKDLDLEAIVDHCPNTLTGADFYALCSDAMLYAMKDRIRLLQDGKTTDQSALEVTEENFLQALSKLTPSVTKAELDRYKQIQARFSGQQIKPDDTSDALRKLDFSQVDFH